MVLAGVELETLVFEPDALTIRPPPCASRDSCREMTSLTLQLKERISICMKLLKCN